MIKYVAAVTAVTLWLIPGFDNLRADVTSSGFAVDSALDETDADPGDGTCSSVADECTLRAAVQEANALRGADTITLPSGIYALSIPGHDEDAAATGDLDITDDLTINGAGPATTIIDAQQLDGVLHIVPETSVSISGLVIQGGLDSGNEPMLRTRVFTGGGILNWGALMLVDAVIRENSTAGPGRAGAGILSGGPVTLIRVVVEANSTSGEGGGMVVGGATVIKDSTLRGNTAALGGAIRSGATLTISGTTIAENSADGAGGGIFNAGDNDLILTNTTISGNSACTGGGLYNYGFDDQMHLNNVTITNNTARGGVGLCGGGGINNFGGIINIRSTLIAGNHDAVGKEPDCHGTVRSHGYNLIQDTTGCALSGSLIGNLIGVEPLLGPLTDNGGLTQTHALLAGSPAIDRGATDVPGSGLGACEITDQRGVSRPRGSGCDIGAYESDFTAHGLPSGGGQPERGDGRDAEPIALLAAGSAGALAGALALRRRLRN